MPPPSRQANIGAQRRPLGASGSQRIAGPDLNGIPRNLTADGRPRHRLG
jgi:hypothetical protein